MFTVYKWKDATQVIKKSNKNPNQKETFYTDDTQ